MGVLIMVKGASGSGKTTSAMNLPSENVEIFSVVGKRLPFRGSKKVKRNATYEDIFLALRANDSKLYLIDDSTYLTQLDAFRRATEKGYDKFVDMAVRFERLLRAASMTDDDTTVYFLHHPQFGEDGGSRPQTVGKMLDNQLCIEGLFDLMLECEVVEGRHCFFTNEHGLAKSPIGMLPRVMDNDLSEVDRLVREYWGMAPLAEGGGSHGGC